MQFWKFATTACIAAAFFVGCKQSTDSGSNNNSNTPTEISLIEQTDLPQTGGSSTSIVQSADGTTISIIDGRLMVVDPTAGSLTQIGTDTTNIHAVFAPNKDLYVVTQNGILKYDVSSGSSTKLTLPITTNTEAQLACAPNGDVYVVNSDGFNRSTVYRSSDHGGSWATLAASPAPGGKYYLAIAPSGDLVIGSNLGIFRSSDLGASWTTLSTDGLNFVDQRVFVSSVGDIYYWTPRIAQMRISRGGGPFTTVASPSNLPAPLEMSEGSGGVLYLTGMDVQNGSDLVASGVMRSTDAGATWSLREIGNVRPIVAHGSTIIAGTVDDGGLLVTTDGTNWKTIGRRTSSGIGDFAFDKDGALLLSAGASVHRKTSTGWQTLGEFGGTPKIVANGIGAIVIFGASVGILQTDDNGATWSTEKMPALISPQWGTSVMFCFARTNNTMILGLAQYNTNTDTWVNGGQFVSADGGKTFTSLRSAGLNFTSMCEDPTTGVLYGHTENFRDELRSDDGGVTWANHAWNFTPMAITNSGKALTTTSLGFKSTPVGTLDWKDLTIKGSTSGFFPKRFIFTSDNKMHLLTTRQLDGTQRLFVSDVAVP